MYKSWLLSSFVCPEICLEYSVQVKNQSESLIDGEETTWEAMRDILVETAENILPKEKKRKRDKKWMTEGILLMMEDRQKLSDRQGSGYRPAGQTNQEEM